MKSLNAAAAVCESQQGFARTCDLPLDCRFAFGVLDETICVSSLPAVQGFIAMVAGLNYRRRPTHDGMMAANEKK